MGRRRQQPALFREKDIDGSALRSVDDSTSTRLEPAGFGITSASCGRDRAQVVNAVVSSFATTRGDTPGELPEGGGWAAGLSPHTSAPQGSSTESFFLHELVQMLRGSTFAMSSRLTKPDCSSAPAYFCASDSEALTMWKTELIRHVSGSLATSR